MSKVFNLQPEKLEDDLIEILPLHEDDFERLFAVASNPMIWQQHPSIDRYKKEVFQIFFDGAVASKSAFLVFDKASKELIGSTRFYQFEPEKSSVAIGYTFLATKYWGGKYNQSMKKLLIDYAFQFVDTVIFHIGTTNIRSQRALLKLGAKMTREIDFEMNGTPIPHFEYEIKKQDWVDK